MKELEFNKDFKLNTTGTLYYENRIIKARKGITAAIFYSYNTPVGYQIFDNGATVKSVVVFHSYSKTTSKHLNKIKEIITDDKRNELTELRIEDFIKEGLKDEMDFRVGANPMELNKVNPFTELLV